MCFQLDKEQMKTVNVGACILASGGGGSYQVSNKIIDQGVKNGTIVTVYEVDEVSPDKWLAVAANMGSPDALFRTANPYAPGNAFQSLQEWCQHASDARFDPRFAGFTQFEYVIPGEMGAINAASPLAVAAQRNIPIIDADGAGRALPTLPLTTYAGNVPLFPNCAASNAEPGQIYNVGQIDVPDEDALEKALIGLVMTEPFGGIAGLAFYAMTGKDLSDHPPVCGTLLDAFRIGDLYEQHEGQERIDAIIDYLTDQRPGEKRQAKQILHGTVTDMVQTAGATDIGRIVITAMNGSDRLWIYNQNENIFAFLNDQTQPYIVGPDSICYVPATGPVFDNSDMWNLFQKSDHEPIEVFVLGIEAPSVVKSNGELLHRWQTTRSQFGYPGSYTQSWLKDGCRTTLWSSGLK